MKALISKNEPVESGYRVCQVEANSKTFEVTDDFFWTSCADNIVADEFWYDPAIETILSKPVPVIPAARNKATAVAKLSATDWVNEPDVYDETLTPHLLNRPEYLTYRSQIRAIAIAPTDGNLDWPTEPTPQWS